MATQPTFRRTRTLGLTSWRGTPDELQGIARTVIEAMDVARTTALTRQQAQVYQKYNTDLTNLQAELGITDLATVDPNSVEGWTYTARSQELWRSTQQAVETASLWIIAGHTFSWTLRGGVQQSGSTPDIFADASLPRNVAGVSIQSNVFATPTSSISIQLQNSPYQFLQLEVTSEDWVWLEATFSRLAEQIRRGESPWVGLLYRPTYGLFITLAVWLFGSIATFELIKVLPFAWLQERSWLSVVFGALPIALFANAMGWLYPRFEVLRSVAREQTDATRWLIVALVSAAVLGIGQWVVRILTKKP